MNLLKDIYYNRDYISLYLKDNEELFEFYYSSGCKYAYNIAIKRRVDKIGAYSLDQDYYDLETVYGYGGFYSNSNDAAFIAEALIAYEQECKKNNIVAEFYRFHIFNEFGINNKQFFDTFDGDRDVVYVDLRLSRQLRWAGYSKKVRNILRKCEKELIFSQSENINEFFDLYNQTMDRNNATNFYYFDKEYFENLLKRNDACLYTVKKDNIVVSSAFFLFGGNFGHYHLSANNYEMRKYNANYFILDQIFAIARNKRKEYFILGGGNSSDKEDSLFRFKQKFSSLRKPFYIAGKIFDKESYDRLNKLWEKQCLSDKKYFLKYRLEL